MYLQAKLRQYACADCGIPCESTSPNAERCRKCATLRQNRQSREYQQKVLARKRQPAISRMLRAEPQQWR